MCLILHVTKICLRDATQYNHLHRPEGMVISMCSNGDRCYQHVYWRKHVYNWWICTYREILITKAQCTRYSTVQSWTQYLPWSFVTKVCAGRCRRLPSCACCPLVSPLKKKRTVENFFHLRKTKLLDINYYPNLTLTVSYNGWPFHWNKHHESAAASALRSLVTWWEIW